VVWQRVFFSTSNGGGLGRFRRGSSGGRRSTTRITRSVTFSSGTETALGPGGHTGPTRGLSRSSGELRPDEIAVLDQLPL